VAPPRPVLASATRGGHSERTAAAPRRRRAQLAPRGRLRQGRHSPNPPWRRPRSRTRRHQRRTSRVRRRRRLVRVGHTPSLAGGAGSL